MKVLIDENLIFKQIISYFIGLPGLVLFWILIFWLGDNGIEKYLIVSAITIIPVYSLFTYYKVYSVKYDDDYFYFYNLFSSFKIKKELFKQIERQKFYNFYLLYFCIGDLKINIEMPSKYAMKYLILFEDYIEKLNDKIKREII
jgi:hypothetical protein